MVALTGRVEVISRQSPVLLVLEDAHWADPSSLEAFGRPIDEIAARHRHIKFEWSMPNGGS